MMIPAGNDRLRGTRRFEGDTIRKVGPPKGECHLNPFPMIAGRTEVFGEAGAPDCGAVDYFQEWGRQRELVLITDGDLTAAAPVLDARLAGLDGADRPAVYVAAPHYRHPTLAFLSENYDTLKWLPQSQAIVFPSAGPALYLYPANSPLPEWVAPYLANATATAYPAGGAPLFTLYELSAPPPLSEPASTVANFADAVTLLSVTTEPAAGGERMPVTLTWRVDGLLPPEWADRPYPSSIWRTAPGSAGPRPKPTLTRPNSGRRVKRSFSALICPCRTASRRARPTRCVWGCLIRIQARD